MAHQIRVFRRGAVYHVTNQTYRGELRLSPGRVVNLLVEGCLGKAARKYGVRLSAFIIMGNHFHLILQAPRYNLDRFMEYFQRELSWRLNRSRGVGATNFPLRYQAEEIGSVEDFERLVARILCNPVRARLVGAADQWPGVSSLDMHRSGEPRRVVRHATRTQAEDIHVHGLSAELERSLEPVDLELSPPPFWAELDFGEVQARISALVDAEQERLQAEIERSAERVVGPNRIERESHDDRPDRVCWRAPTRVISRDPDFEAAYHAWYEDVRTRYRRSARRWRQHREWRDYPPGTFPPGWPTCIPPSSRAGPRLPWQPPVLEVA